MEDDKFFYSIEKKKKIVQITLNFLRKLFPNAKSELLYDKPYEFLFAVILSARNTDKQVNKTTKSLFVKYDSIEKFANAKIETLQQDISSIGLYKNKANFIKKSAQILIEKFNSIVPNNIDELLTLSGVGRKTANVVLGELYKKNEGIAVDTHVARITYLLNLTKNKDPVKIENDLMAIVPKKNWYEINSLIVLYGRYFWKARKEDNGGLLKEIEEKI